MNKISIIKIAIIILLISLLIYTRFLNIGWGLPYPFHPDERNMADALVRLTPDNFLKPDFYAYGQLPLYTGYLLIRIYQNISTKIEPITFDQAVISLRVISSIASVVTFGILVKLLLLIINAKKDLQKNFVYQPVTVIISAGAFIFSPVLIQFAHFGTTESLLMLFYTSIIYLSAIYIHNVIHTRKFVLAASILVGLATGTKVSALIFIVLPLVAIAWNVWHSNTELKLLKILFWWVKSVSIAGIAGIIASPYNIAAFNEFIGSITYESNVGTGTLPVFYTTQFSHTVPVLFQFFNVFPYALGIPVMLLFIAGFLLLPINKTYTVLRTAFLIYFLPNAFIYTKWTRFMAPVFPVMILIALLFLFHIYAVMLKLKQSDNVHRILNISFCVLLFIAIVPGIAFLSVYQTEDVRFTASHWIYKHIPENSYILQETANVVNLPITSPADLLVHRYPFNYQIHSFDYYHIDDDPTVREKLNNALQSAQYIVMPSRRIVMNYTCLPIPDKLKTLKQNVSGQAVSSKLINFAYFSNRCEYLEAKYPELNEYYKNLFNGSLGYIPVAEFNSYPKIELFGKTFVEFPDEYSEESFSVFDHPVVRIYKKI